MSTFQCDKRSPVMITRILVRHFVSNVYCQKLTSLVIRVTPFFLVTSSNSVMLLGIVLSASTGNEVSFHSVVGSSK